jgi:hypothetical protein
MQMRETSTSESGNYFLPPNFAIRAAISEKTDGIFDMPQSWVMGHIIFGCPKNPTASAGFEPTNSGSSGQYANH